MKLFEHTRCRMFCSFLLIGFVCFFFFFAFFLFQTIHELYKFERKEGSRGTYYVFVNIDDHSNLTRVQQCYFISFSESNSIDNSLHASNSKG